MFGFIKKLFVDPETGDLNKQNLIFTAVGAVSGLIYGGPVAALMVGALGLGASEIAGNMFSFGSNDNAEREDLSPGVSSAPTVDYGDGSGAQLEPQRPNVPYGLDTGRER